ncbi:unnamed protein product [Absidia cylindrospora]
MVVFLGPVNCSFFCTGEHVGCGSNNDDIDIAVFIGGDDGVSSTVCTCTGEHVGVGSNNDDIDIRVFIGVCLGGDDDACGGGAVDVKYGDIENENDCAGDTNCKGDSACSSDAFASGDGTCTGVAVSDGDAGDNIPTADDT